MERPVSSWGPEAVARWLRGLDNAVQQYPFEEWQLTGEQLLCLSYQDMEKLGVKKIGHQELILESIEQLCALNYDLERESLRTLIEKLKAVSQTLQGLIRSRRKVNTYDGNVVQMAPAEQLTSVVDVIATAKAMLWWLNRCLVERMNDYPSSKKIVALCTELADCVQKDCTTSERENRILAICRDLCGISDNILGSSPATLLSQTASLETVNLVPVSPGDGLGIELRSTSSSLHFISGTAVESPADHSHKIQVGDEIIQVNDQVVVGWTQLNLANKIRENPSQVTLVLKKSGVSSSSQMVGSFLNAESSLSRNKTAYVRSFSNPVRSRSRSSIKKQEELPQSPLTGPEQESFQNWDHTWIQSPGTSKNQEPELHTDKDISVSTDDIVLAFSNPIPDSDSEPTSPLSPGMSQLNRTRSQESCRSNKEPSAHQDTSLGQTKRRSKRKGVSTKLSRRRISCVDLGQVDCNGWLWQKKENAGFMATKWRRGWFVLKKHALYWYTSPNDEKAEGFIDVSTYSIESAGEHKRKYVFKLYHAKFKSFIFAAENLADMSTWITHLLNVIRKYAARSKQIPSKEEDCYSETEAEDADDDSVSLQTLNRTRSDSQSQSSETQNPDASSSSPIKIPSPTVKFAKDSGNSEPIFAEHQTADPPEDDMGMMLKGLQQGGVTLIGKKKSFTREQYRSSFIKRNKNPVINEKIHKVRALKSTLKAKEAELQTIDRLLLNPKLTLEKFRKWKADNQELHREIMELAQRSRIGKTGNLKQEPKEHSNAPREQRLNSLTSDNAGCTKNPDTLASSRQGYTEDSSHKADLTPQTMVSTKPKTKKQETLV